MGALSAADGGVVVAPTNKIAFIDLKAQQERIRPELERAMRKVLDHGQYIMGPEVESLEDGLRAFAGARHAISCASGTDALLMVLMARGIGPGDAVICPGFTYTATPEVIALLGATPVFADVDATTFNLDPSQLQSAIDAARSSGLEPKAVIAVDLFGQPADYSALTAIAEANGLFVLADAAQSFGASIADRRVGTFGVATATSFFPAKPLGCYGDGGAILTDDDDLAEALRSIRQHGKGHSKYDIVRVGINGRLDTLQAAVLLEKLRIFPDELERRQAIAIRYAGGLAGHVECPQVPTSYRSAWAQYTVIVPQQRDEIMRDLAALGVPTQVYYPKSLNRQTAYQSYPVASSGLPVAERLPDHVISLPMHPYLTEADQSYIIEAVRKVVVAL
ncbi:MAG: DegT/DnrJ/EryC1/StrS aminotransferase family protein [Hyphomicrobiaceae bacterium]